jgi:hypothetical protein
VRELRSDAVERKRRQTAYDAAGDGGRGHREPVVFADPDVRPAIDAACDAIDGAFGDETSDSFTLHPGGAEFARRDAGATTGKS